VYRILITPPKHGEATLDNPSALQNSDNPTRKAANAELVLSDALTGLTLCGFSVWDNGESGLRVSFPARRFVAPGGRPGSFILLRATNRDDLTSYERLQHEIVDAYLQSIQRSSIVQAGVRS
jgi:hypothetical protein